MFLPPAIITVLAHFQPAFTRPTYRKVLVLLVGTLLTRGRHTVTAALWHMGLQHTTDWAKYHHVLNRSTWSALTVSRMLLNLLVTTFISTGATVDIVIDETLERRWGRKLPKRGQWRDSLLSSKRQNVTNSGLRWVVMALVVSLPWTRQRWALPFLSVLATTPKVSHQLNKRHKTVPRLAQQMVKVVRRWLPQVPITLMGDTAYSVLDLGTVCQHAQVALIAPLRLDARLFAPPPTTKAATGRPGIVGQRLPHLSGVLTDARTGWDQVTIAWYGSTSRTFDLTTGTALWYSTGFAPLCIRWVLVRDPRGTLPSRAFFCTDPCHTAASIVGDFVKRWCMEVTFEESRAHLGLETQRQWSDKAVERGTPALLGVFSLTTLLGHTLFPNGQIPVRTTAWYRKRHATCGDVLAAVRRAAWDDVRFQTSPSNPNMVVVPRAELIRLAHAVCY